MKRNVANRVARRKRRVLKRLERARELRFIRGLDSTTVIGANAITYELSERVHAIGHGGIGMMMKLARNTGLVNEIDRRVHLLKVQQFPAFEFSNEKWGILSFRFVKPLGRILRWFAHIRIQAKGFAHGFPRPR